MRMLLEQLSPYIRVAMDSKIDFPWHLTERVLFEYELLYVKEGRIKVTIEDQSYIGEPVRRISSIFLEIDLHLPLSAATHATHTASSRIRRSTACYP